jgi:diguanylate cyclase (GGDEF)-like protein/PAS domain S-box-containing protein
MLAIDRPDLLAGAFDHAPIAMAVLTPTGLIGLCNPATGVLLRRGCADLIGTTFRDIVHPDDRADAQRVCDDLLAGGARTVRREWRLVLVGGAAVWVCVDAASLPVTARALPHLLVQLTDITERKARETTLVHQALHDPLTGLPNRLLLTERIDQACTPRRGRNARPHCLFYLDLNGFKAVNDRFGHATGDRVLQLLAERLLALLRPDDTAARLGGDEFAVLCVDLEPRHCARVAERLCTAAATPFVIDNRSITISAAVGAVTAQPSGAAAHDAAVLLHQADRRMYEQKRTPTTP